MQIIFRTVLSGGGCSAADSGSPQRAPSKNVEMVNNTANGDRVLFFMRKTPFGRLLAKLHSKFFSKCMKKVCQFQASRGKPVN